ncbi:MAG TPA: hypothetical protein VLA34_10610, partial [Candidatus Krumholzibacterium sp.]|nr:hypothetical protein [Candidatus Krumholzibacterium sp.]
MKRILMIVGSILVIISSNCNQRSGLNTTTDSYLGQKPPGMRPELFAPGILSTEANEFNATFTPSGDAVYFTGRGKDGQDIMIIEYKDGKLQDRRTA